MEKQGPKSGNYVGGFLQLFDWKGKSRKKLFSGKSDVPEQSKQKKRSDRNLPSTRIQMVDEDEVAAVSSIRGSSDYSCASSVNDEDFYVTKAPNVVARLMGLESLPKSNEPYSSPLYDSQSLSDSYYRTRNLEYCRDPQIMHSGSLSVQGDTRPKYQSPLQSRIEKFQTEILPPKSAKSIPITHHRLMSPIKSANTLRPKDAAHIMEEAARIIEPRLQGGTKAKLPPVNSSTAPLKVKDLKEKVQASQKRTKVSQKQQGESSAVKNLKGQSINKSYDGHSDGASSVRNFVESEAKDKGKSISLALQAKANVQKRGGLNSGRTSVREKEMNELCTDQLFKSQPPVQKSTQKKSSTLNGSGVLRQNNQKQNCIGDRGKAPLKSNIQNGKTLNGDSSARQRNASKASATSRVSSRKQSSDSKDDERKVMCSSSERVTRKKRSIDGTYHSETNRVENDEREGQSRTMSDNQNSWEQDSAKNGTDVVSFTFTSPLSRSNKPFEIGKGYSIFSEDSRSKRTLLGSDGSVSRFSFLENNLKGGDALSSLLEQKLKELTEMVEFPRQKTEVASLASSTMAEDNKAEDGRNTNSTMGLLEERGMHCNQAIMYLDSRLPSPVSVLEHSSSLESYNSTNAADTESSGMAGGDQCSSTIAREELPYSFTTFIPNGHTELSDSASSIFARSFTKKQGTTSTLTLSRHGKRASELEYISQILFNVELMFKNYALGKATEMIDHHLFNQLECRKGSFGDCELGIKSNRRLLFDSVNECLELRCSHYVNGGYRLWAKGLSVVKKKERLAEDVYKEISGWSGLGDSMVDDIVDKDMSSQYGRWLDFELEAFELGVQIESRILNSLIDEVVADILVL